MRPTLRLTTQSLFGFALSAMLLGGVARASNYELNEIPQSIPAKDAQKLKGAGISTTFTLLERAAEPKARKALARETKVSEEQLLEWAQMADLLRVRGIGPDVARLLQAANVKTVDDLKKSDPVKLTDALNKANAKLKLSENPPSTEHLKAWIDQSQTLPTILK